MKFKMRLFADQIVGVFIILSLVAIAFVIVLLGKSQEWFTKKYEFYTIFPSANGLSKNMAVQYKGFTIGNVKNFDFDKDDKDDNVRVIFDINEKYIDRVKSGSIVELQASPIGLGNQFIFYAGKGEVKVRVIKGEKNEKPTIAALDSTAKKKRFIPRLDSNEANNLNSKDKAEIKRDDSISVLLGNVSSIMGKLDDAMGTGSDDNKIAEIINELTNKVKDLDKMLEGITEKAVGIVMKEIDSMLEPTLNEVNKKIRNLEEQGGLLDLVLGKDKTNLQEQGGLLDLVLGKDNEAYKSLVESLNLVSSMLDSLDETIAFVPTQLPQVSRALIDASGAIQAANEAITGLKNNPLHFILNGSEPSRTDSQNSNIGPRGIRFIQ